MRHLIVAVLLAALTVPACAKSHKEDFNFNAPCATVWPILRDAVVNSGKPNVVFDDRGMAVCYGVGRFFPCKNEIILSAQGDQCTMKTDTGSSGPDVQDAEDFKKQVEQSLAKLQVNPSAQPEPAPFSVPAAAPAGTPGTPAQTGAGARVTLTVAAHCAKDPDSFGIVSSSMYSDCKQRELDNLRSWVVSALADRHVVVANGNEGGDYRVTVTMTKSMDKRPSSLMPFGDFMPGTYMFEASYQIVDSSGRVLNAGSVTHQGPDSPKWDDVEKQFAVKIADSLNQKLATRGSAAAGGSTDIPAAPHIQTPVDIAAQANLYEIMAQAYRSLAVKPVLPDDARLQKHKAEDALKAHDPNAAGAAYAAALKSASWWPEGFRGLALALSQTNHTEQAIVWMRRYLAFVPDAPDAAQMQAKIDEWSRLAPPPPPPLANLPMPPGLHLGVASTDTPSIVAMASGNPDLEGALIEFVYTGSTAEAAGLAKGDIVLSYNGAPVRNAQDLIANAAKATPGASAELEVQRGQTKISIKVQF